MVIKVKNNKNLRNIAQSVFRWNFAIILYTGEMKN